MVPPDSPPARRLAALWFADIVGYTERSTEDEQAAMHMVEDFQQVCRASVAEQGGRVIKFIGDAALAEFSSSEAAVRAALSLRSGFATTSAEAPALRIGVHVGAVVSASDGDVYGDGVNTAARLQDEAMPGQILVSEDVWRQLKPLGQFSFGGMDRRRLRGMPRRLGIYELYDESPSPRGRPLGVKVLRYAGRFLFAGRRRAVMMAVLLLSLSLLWEARQAWVATEATSTETVASDLDPTHIAVLYFEDRSPDQQLGWLTTALTERLIHELNQVDALDVVPPGGVKPFRDQDLPLDTIVRSLGVGSIVEGSVTRSGDRVRVTVHLIDGATKAQGDSEIVEQEGGGTMELEDRLARTVAEILRRSLGREIRMRETRRGTNNGQAYDLLLRAREMREDFRKLRMTDAAAGRQRLLRADSLLARVERMDSTWVEPILERGWVARAMAMEVGPLPGTHDEGWSRVALGHAERAVLLMPAEGSVYELRGILKHDYSKIRQGEARTTLVREAEADLRHAVEIDYKRARAWWTLSELLVEQTRFSDASLAAEKALAADSFLENVPSVLYQIFDASLQFGAEDEAVTACNEGRQRFPGDSDFIVCQLFLLASFPQVDADVDRAWALADSLPDTVGDENREAFRALGVMLVAQTAARAGLSDSARAIMRIARGDDPTPSWLAYNEAHARLMLGEPDSAVELLSRFLVDRADTARIARDWWFEPLWSDSGFLRIVGQSN